MEKRVIGMVLTILGVLSLIVAGYNFVGHDSGNTNVKIVVSCMVLGLIFFISGISLIRTTHDVIKNDEHMS
jgi:uncharacterized membrane protein